MLVDLFDPAPPCHMREEQGLSDIQGTPACVKALKMLAEGKVRGLRSPATSVACATGVATS